MNRFCSHFIVALALTFLTSSSAFALSLEDAKQRGLVGETPSGYLEAVAPSAEAQQLVNEINQKRTEAYKAIAAKNGAGVDAVAQIAGKEAIEKAPSGTYVKLPGGNWTRK